MSRFVNTYLCFVYLCAAYSRMGFAFSHHFSGSRSLFSQNRLLYSFPSSEATSNNIFDINTEDFLQPMSGIGSSLTDSPTLVLNADYTPLSYLPLSLWNWQDSLRAIIAEKANVVAEYNLVIRGVSCSLKLPSVIALKQYHKYIDGAPMLTRGKVFLRDVYTCQYCLESFGTDRLSLDHVVPRSRGGKLTWTNTVTACKQCNFKKGQHLVDEIGSLGMKLRNRPREPSGAELQSKARKLRQYHRLHPDWSAYL